MMSHKTMIAGALALAFVPGAAIADDDEIPFSVARIFFELNNTDGDLGIHALIDGDPWKRLKIEDTKEREMLNIRLRGRLRRQGLTELFFESAEPPFESEDPDEVTLLPEEFFARFPEGEYEVEGKTIEGDELESTARVTHLMPAPPVISMSDSDSGPAFVSEDCDEDPGPSVSDPITVSWDAVTLSHPDIGRTNEPIVVKNYELVLEQVAPLPPVKFTAILPSNVTSVQLPFGLLAPGDAKIEVLVREDSNNQTANESCFQVEVTP